MPFHKHASAIAGAVESMKKKPLTVKALQEYFRQRSSKIPVLIVDKENMLAQAYQNVLYSIIVVLIRRMLL
ncbi:MAG: hypothetical protein AABZ57_05095 [Candidatus Margulisiibacteriota bacterium]